MYQVIIIEDDPMVAAIDKKYVEADGAFQVAGIFKSGAEALEHLSSHRADLIILDYYTPLMSGQEFLDRLHASGQSPSVIMVTSANDTHIVRSLLSRGVLDYLVKPFEFARFRQALEKFRQTRQLLESGRGNLDQQEIDSLLFHRQAPPTEACTLTKGLNPATLGLIRSFLSESRSDSFTSEQIAERVHLSRITIRRYVNYMVETGELTSSVDYQTGGRPSIRYRYTGSG